MVDGNSPAVVASLVVFKRGSRVCVEEIYVAVIALAKQRAAVGTGNVALKGQTAAALQVNHGIDVDGPAVASSCVALKRRPTPQAQRGDAPGPQDGYAAAMTASGVALHMHGAKLDLLLERRFTRRAKAHATAIAASAVAANSTVDIPGTRGAAVAQIELLAAPYAAAVAICAVIFDRRGGVHLQTLGNRSRHERYSAAISLGFVVAHLAVIRQLHAKATSAVVIRAYPAAFFFSDVMRNLAAVFYLDNVQLARFLCALALYNGKYAAASLERRVIGDLGVAKAYLAGIVHVDSHDHDAATRAFGMVVHDLRAVQGDRASCINAASLSVVSQVGVGHVAGYSHVVQNEFRAAVGRDTTAGVLVVNRPAGDETAVKGIAAARVVFPELAVGGAVYKPAAMLNSAVTTVDRAFSVNTHANDLAVATAVKLAVSRGFIAIDHMAVEIEGHSEKVAKLDDAIAVAVPVGKQVDGKLAYLPGVMRRRSHVVDDMHDVTHAGAVVSTRVAALATHLAYGVSGVVRAIGIGTGRRKRSA